MQTIIKVAIAKFKWIFTTTGFTINLRKLDSILIFLSGEQNFSSQWGDELTAAGECRELGEIIAKHESQIHAQSYVPMSQIQSRKVHFWTLILVIAYNF